MDEILIHFILSLLIYFIFFFLLSSVKIDRGLLHEVAYNDDKNFYGFENTRPKIIRGIKLGMNGKLAR